MEFEVKAKGFTGSESNIGNPFSAYRILHIYIYSVCFDTSEGNQLSYFQHDYFFKILC